jgi:hypothetical protein
VRVVGVTALALAAFLAAGAAASAGSTGKASLRLASYQPLTVHGQRFVARERVRLEVFGVARVTRRVVASRTGAFAVRFADVRVTRCDLVRVVATGGSGSRAALKFLPAPACLAE